MATRRDGEKKKKGTLKQSKAKQNQSVLPVCIFCSDLMLRRLLNCMCVHSKELAQGHCLQRTDNHDDQYFSETAQATVPRLVGQAFL